MIRGIIKLVLNTNENQQLNYKTLKITRINI